MNEKPCAFLGQYLVGKGLINENQLEDAIRLQKENNSLVGTIALAQGFLDKKQLNYLVRQQTRVDERIGTLALQEGLLSQDELDTVLTIQGKNHIFLGESLVRLGMISKQVLDEALRRFERQIVNQQIQVKEAISHLPSAKEMLVTLDVSLRFFYRLGYPVRIVGMADCIPERFEHLFCSEQVFKKAGTSYMGVGMTTMLLESILQRPGLRDRPDESDADTMENMSQLIFNLNYMICNQMKKLGIRVKHGAAFISMPSDNRVSGVCLEMETVTSPMVLAYGDQPSSPTPYRTAF